MEKIKYIIAIASGKGGVGKSTTAVNLALGFKKAGLSVGLLDADIYGPSIPRLLGTIEEKPKIENKIMTPVNAFGIDTMSMGYLVPKETATIWRGPMVTSAIQQFIHNVNWKPMDILVVDFPPGTGDIHLTLAQTLPISGAVIVSTPQDIALIDARKGLAMFDKVNVPTLGIIENMSYFVCPHCNHKTNIFSHGGAKIEAESSATNFLGEIPLDVHIRETSDNGSPIVYSSPNSPQAKQYMAISSKILEIVESISNSRVEPIIGEE